ncbi:MAG: GNVR domain-containing protein [Candidatus Deferrimicrobiaceae bacterium]
MPLRPKMEVREYAKLFLRRKWIIVFSVLSILFAATVYCVVSPELYKSSISILVIPQTVPEDYVRSTISLRVDEQLSTIKQQVMSRTTLTKVMEELHLFEKERKSLTSEVMFARMRKRIEIDVVQGQSRGSSEVFSLSFLHENPEGAMHAAALLASIFIEENLKTREHQAVGTSEFLESQLKGTKAMLEVMEKRVKEYKMQYMGELPQQMDANLRMLTGLQDRLRSNESSIRSAEERKALLEVQLSLIGKTASSGTNGDGKPVLVFSHDPSRSLGEELAQKKARLADLTSKYTEMVPEVSRAMQDVADLEARIEEARRSAAALTARDKKADHQDSAGVDEIRRMEAPLKAVMVEIASLKKEKEEVRKSIASVEQKLKQTPRREQEMISLIRDYDNQKLSYNDMMKKKLQADVSQNLEKRQKGTQFQILDPANLPEVPFQPNRKLVMGASLLFSLFLGFGVAVVREAMDMRLRDVRDFRHLYKVPILGYIPVFHDQQFQRQQSLRRAAVFGGLITATMVFSVFLLMYRDKIRTILKF